MRDNFDEVIPYIGSWVFFLRMASIKATQLHPGVLKFSLKNTTQSIFHNVPVNLKSEERRMELPQPDA